MINQLQANSIKVEFEVLRKHHMAAFDMDGVLCEEPTPGTFDPSNAVPFYIPDHPIHLIITARNEKYRQQTLDWLAKHSVTAYRVAMPTWEEYPGLEAVARWKAEEYRKSRLPMFVESNIDIARIVAREACMPVYCPSARKTIEPESPVLGNSDAIGRRVRVCPHRLDLCCGSARCAKRDHVIVYRDDCRSCPDLPLPEYATVHG
jgi:hypothetical protein